MSFGKAVLPRLLAFPKSGTAYNECLYAAVARQGVEIVEGVWAGRWLLENVRRGDIVHIHWPSFLYYDPNSSKQRVRKLTRFFALYAILRMRGGRVVWTAHNLYPHDGGRHVWMHRLVRRFITRDAKAIIAHGPTARKILIGEFGIPNGKIFEMLHGHWIGYHPHTISKQDARRDLHIPESAFVYCIVGAGRPYKNVEALIDSFARQDGDCLLVIAGRFPSSEYRAKIDALLAKLPPARIRVAATFIPNDDVQKFVLAGDAFVVPYTEILTSGSAMLGLSFGIPVIAPNMGNMADVITERCGLLYDPDEKEALTQAMRQIRQRKYSSKEIIEYAGTFDWDKSAVALVEAVRAIS